jgi:hypothetical protein
MTKLPLFAFALLLVCSGCKKSINAHERLTELEYTALLDKIAPYVIKKPDEIEYENRFDSVSLPYYQNFIKLTGGEIRYIQETDTANFFAFVHRDHTSLYEHYRALGGYYRTDDAGNIIFLNLLYHTPRFTKEEMEQKGELLFKEMVRHGDVKRFIGNRGYIHVPNKDFYYNTKTNRWNHTDSSSWRFLDDARQEAEQ